MNNIINKCLCAGDKFMTEFHLRLTGFTFSACGPFTKQREGIQKFREAVDLKHIYKKELDEACFANDEAYYNSEKLLVNNLLMLIILIFLKNLNRVLKLLHLKLVIEERLLSVRIF